MSDEGEQAWLQLRKAARKAGQLLKSEHPLAYEILGTAWWLTKLALEDAKSKRHS